MLSRRRWNYENNCAAIVCYVSTGLATSSTQLADLSNDIIQRHHQLTQSVTVDNVNEILTYTVNKLLKAKNTSSSPMMFDATQSNSHTTEPIRAPALHIKIFYQVTATPPIDLIIRTIADFRERNSNQMSVAFTVIPASSLHNFSTFLSIYGIRHE